MLACATNILFPAIEASHARYAVARAWIESRIDHDTFALCELVLVETYTLLRNPLIGSKPLSAAAAVIEDAWACYPQVGSRLDKSHCKGWTGAENTAASLFERLEKRHPI